MLNYHKEDLVDTEDLPVLAWGIQKRDWIWCRLQLTIQKLCRDWSSSTLPSFQDIQSTKMYRMWY